ncbi:hypothetical protein K2173_013669 [Erythroxylum novogranatense]|uniref:Transposase n=1 Tax=Erythroxylum novogranatense TaxID=1862640 RepID=A0AAV8SA23_9ROSI|nr:hypothetical protein K2173_013669 [Erythroxylum novogranatense]
MSLLFYVKNITFDSRMIRARQLLLGFFYVNNRNSFFRERKTDWCRELIPYYEHIQQNDFAYRRKKRKLPYANADSMKMTLLVTVLVATIARISLTSLVKIQFDIKTQLRLRFLCIRLLGSFKLEKSKLMIFLSELTGSFGVIDIA